jgi:hypothetical protein
MFANLPRKNTLFTTNTLVVNTVMYSQFTSPTQVTIQNTTYNNIVNNYNIVKCGGCGAGKDDGCQACGDCEDCKSVSDMKFNFDIWDTFTDVVNTINHLLTEFSLGHFDKVTQSLSMDYYNSVSKMLLEIKMDPGCNPEYELVRNTIAKSFEGLYQSRNLYIEYMNDQQVIEALKQKANILDNMDSLKEYLQNMKNNFPDVFPPSHITTIPVVIKPEYLEYIKEFGFPQGAIFDTDKLAVILMRMGIQTDDISIHEAADDVADPENRSQLRQQVLALEYDFSNVPLIPGVAALNSHSTGQEILNYFGVPGHVDASSGYFDLSGVFHRHIDSSLCDSSSSSSSSDSDSLFEW